MKLPVAAFPFIGQRPTCFLIPRRQPNYLVSRFWEIFILVLAIRKCKEVMQGKSSSSSRLLVSRVVDDEDHDDFQGSNTDSSCFVF
jgi:hypothetical protein